MKKSSHFWLCLAFGVRLVMLSGVDDVNLAFLNLAHAGWGAGLTNIFPRLPLYGEEWAKVVCIDNETVATRIDLSKFKLINSVKH